MTSLHCTCQCLCFLYLLLLFKLTIQKLFSFNHSSFYPYFKIHRPCCSELLLSVAVATAQNSGASHPTILCIITKFSGLFRESGSFGCTFQVEMNLTEFWFGYFGMFLFHFFFHLVVAKVPG